MNNKLYAVLALAAAAGLGAIAALLLSPTAPGGSGAGDGKGEPLYWVAPMDPDYRRDGPGKSPMGMDLVPVYEKGDGREFPPGTVEVSPAVMNSLGVRTAAVEMRGLAPSLQTVGIVRWDEDRLTHVHPRVAGWVEKLFVKAAGDPVRAGEPLYALYSPDLVNAQEEFLLGLTRQNEGLLRATRDRLEALQIPPALVSVLEEERRVQQTVVFRSAKNGIVDELFIREGFYVKPDTTLMAIGSLESVWVEAEVLERQTALVEEGMAVSMTAPALPGREWTGRVDYIYPSLDPKARTLRLRLRFENPDGALQPNMYTRISLRAASGPAVPTVPRDAVIRTASGERVVRALGEGRFRSVPVTLGASDAEFFEIRAGVAPGERVVTSAQFLLDSESSRSAGLDRLSPPTVDPGAEGHDAMDHGAMDHGSMDHDEIDHGSMDHAAMGHGDASGSTTEHAGMDHSGMDHSSMDRSSMADEPAGDDRSDQAFGDHDGHGTATDDAMREPEQRP